MNPSPDNNQASPSLINSAAKLFYINQDFKVGRESFTVTDGQNVVCCAKVKILAIKKHIDVYRDEAATQQIFAIQQTKLVSLHEAFEVVSTSGQKIGEFRLQAMESVMKEHWDILDSNDTVIGAIDQAGTAAMLGRVIGNVVPQSFAVTVDGQSVGNFKEEMSIGMYFKMDIDFTADTGGKLNTTLGVAAAILLSARHMQAK